MAQAVPALRFEKSAYYFAAFLVLAIVGFWPSYFSGVFQGHTGRAVYFHLHTLMVCRWLLLLIVQPLLIRYRQLPLHRLLGRSSYVVFPLLLLSVVLLAHSRIPANIVMVDNAPNVGQHLFIPFKDLLILRVAFFIAIRWRHTVSIHARGMVATGLVFIEPALVRLFRNVLGATDHFLAFNPLHSLFHPGDTSGSRASAAARSLGFPADTRPVRHRAHHHPFPCADWALE